MNDKETYGVELELVTNKFKKGMKEVMDVFKNYKKFQDNVNSFQIQPVIKDDDIKTQIDKIKSTLGALFRDNKIRVNIDNMGNIMTSKAGLRKINKLPQEDIEALQMYMTQMQEALKSGDKELIDSFTATKEGAHEIDDALRRIKADLKEMPTLTDKIKKGFEGIKEVTTPIKNIFSKISGFFGRFKKDTSGTSGIGGSISSAFNKGISSVKRFGVALLGVRGIYGLLTKAVRSYLGDHQDVANQMNAMISGIGNLLAPAIEYVLNIVSKLLSYANAFIKMLTGVDLFAKGMESINKSAKKTAKSVNDIKGGLAGIDEITNIASDSGNNGNNSPNGDTSLLPKVDIAPLEKLKTFLSKIFEPFEKAWNKTKTSFVNSAKTMVEKVGGMFKSIGGSILEVWTNGTGEQTITYIIQLFEKVFDIVGNIGEAIRIAWDYNGQGTEFVQNIADIFNSILDFVNEIGESLRKWTASEGFQTAMTRIGTIIKDISKYVKDIVTWVVDMYKKYLAPVVDELLDAISEIIIAIGDIWNAIKPVVDKVVEVVKGIIEPIIKVVSNAIKGIITAVKGVAQFISGIFTQDWEKAWTGIKNIFGGIWDGMKSLMIAPINWMIGAVETFINWIIDAFNGAKKLLNLIGIDVGQTSHVHLGRIGQANISEGANGVRGGLSGLASGTPYVEREGLAYLHQGEAVVPEKFNDRKYFGNDEETKDLLRELITTIEDKDVNTYLDGKVIGKTSVDYINNQTRMLGRSVI